jgi:hypothetical protein
MEYSDFAHIMMPTTSLSVNTSLLHSQVYIFPLYFSISFSLLDSHCRSVDLDGAGTRSSWAKHANSYPWRLLKASRVYRQFRSWISGPRYTTLLSLSASWMLLCWSMWKTRCCDPSFALQFYNQIHAHPGRCGMLFTGRDTCMHNNDTHMAHTQSQTQCVFIIS